jgi:hypothetical protein
VKSGKADWLIEGFSRSTEIGFAVLDNEFRYQAINAPLADINGLPGNAHLGLKVGEIFGELSEKLAVPHYRRVFDHGERTHFEITGASLPSRRERAYSGVNVNFPIREIAGTVTHMGIIVLEVTQQRRLQSFLRELTGHVYSPNSSESCWFAHKIRRCIDEYISTLAVTFEDLLGTPAISFEQLVESIKALDQRLWVMRQTTSDLEMSFPGANPFVLENETRKAQNPTL